MVAFQLIKLMSNAIYDFVVVLDLWTRVPPNPVAQELKLRDCTGYLATLQKPELFSIGKTEK